MNCAQGDSFTCGTTSYGITMLQRKSLRLGMERYTGLDIFQRNERVSVWHLCALGAGTGRSPAGCVLAAERMTQVRLLPIRRLPTTLVMGRRVLMAGTVGSV